MTNQLKNITELLNELTPLAKEIERRRLETFDIGFNVFQLASDTYYRENFHSYILYNLINPEYHEEGKLFLNLFIDCLNECGPVKIDKNDFQNSIVERESDRVDIRIRDKDSGKSIIVENKMNGAPDQYRQIPRYHKIEEKSGFEIPAVVYLTLIDGKVVSTLDWTEDEIQVILPKIIYLPAIASNRVNLINNWLKKCIQASVHEDIPAILRQYRNIINYLNRQQMDQNLLEKFYASTQDEEKFRTALEVREMLSKLCEHRAQRILKHFSKSTNRFAGKAVFPHKGEWRAKFQDSTFSQISLWIDIACREDTTKIFFVESQTKELDKLGTFLNTLKIDFTDSEHDDAFEKSFKYPSQEKELYSYLTELFQKLEAQERTEKISQ